MEGTVGFSVGNGSGAALGSGSQSAEASRMVCLALSSGEAHSAPGPAVGKTDRVRSGCLPFL